MGGIAAFFLLLLILVTAPGAYGEQHAITHTCEGGTQERKLYVTTVDGGLTALDLQGYVLWQYHLSEPLFSSTLSYGKPEEGVPDLIPGLDRNLYHWDGKKLERLPASADDLIDELYPFSPGTFLTGAKAREVIGINTHNGQPVYECSSQNCHRYDNQSLISNIDVLMLTTLRLTIRQATIAAEELWNFTVGDVKLSVVEGMDGGLFSCMPLPLDWTVQVDTLAGVVYAVRRLTSGELSTVWERKLSAPITDVWIHDSGRLERMATALEGQPSLMLVNYQRQYYVQRVVPDRAPLLTAQPSYNPARSKVGGDEWYKLVVPEDLQGESHDIMLYYNDDTFLRLCTPGPHGLAMYFYLEGFEDLSGTCTQIELENCSQETHTLPVPQQHRSMVERLWSAGVSAVKYVLFALFVLGLNKLHQYHRGLSRKAKEEGDMSKASSAQTVIPTVDSKSSNLDSQDSRFDMDYELKGCLGKGGFGVVYHVRNKTDGGEYAVKRIKLPYTKSSREKVMREVHALAQLEHPKIVRYFHSWVERGWSETLSRGESQPRTDLLSSALSPCPSPCPSFASLNHSTIHSEIPPRLSVESRNSSFSIEFRDDTLGEEGCFSRDLMAHRDDLSSSSTDSHTHLERAADPGERPTYVFIQMQLCQKESLKEWLGKNIHNRCRRKVMNFFEQVLDAVLYVHGKGMMHRDLKPSNIFFSLDGSVKVGDFGLVTGSMFRGLRNSHLALKSLADDHSHLHTGNIGSHFYMSPEQMSGAKYDQKVDIFSLGVIFFELHYPFLTEMERVKVLEDLRQQKFPQRFKTILPLEADFVVWLMAPLPSQRPSAVEVHSSKRLKELKQKLGQSEHTTIPKL